MLSLLREEWIKNPELSKWSGRRCTYHKCTCDKPKLVELWDQDSCIRGRIDTVVCTKCDGVNTFKIIR
jgi:hypothetical protein